jgi:hypothetical protein
MYSITPYNSDSNNDRTPKINEEYAKLVPEISQSDYQSFKASIKENGLFVLIVEINME